MKKRFPLITGVLLLIAGTVCYWCEPPFMLGLSRRVFDIFLRENAVPVQTDSVAIVDIDETSLEKYGQWPWPRTRLAELVSALWETGAAVAAFDVIFVEPDRMSPERLSGRWATEFGAEIQIHGLPPDLRDFDSAFSDTFSQGPVVLGCYMNSVPAPVAKVAGADSGVYHGRVFEMGKSVRARLLQAGGSLQPIPQLAKAAAGIGFINTQPDQDNIVRRTPMVFAYGPGRIYPSLSLEATRLFAAARQIGMVYDPSGSGVRELRVLDRVIPTDACGRMPVNYRSSRFPRYSVADVLAGRLADGALQGKVVFVGTSAAGLQDLVSTPLSSEFPGVEVHATVVDNLLAGDILQEPHWIFTAEILSMLVGGLIVILLVVFTPATVSLLIMLLADILVLGTSIWLLKARQLIVLPAEILWVWGLVFVGVLSVKYLQEGRDRRRVRRMFGTMVSPGVLKYLEQNPKSFSLTGIKAEATIFFSDVAGFTTISEQLEPARLAELLNRYLSPMTDIIMARAGYVDKYEGDAVMAEWGVPFPKKDHAAQACYAALEQQEKLAGIRPQLKREFGCELNVRMGINTGVVSAGNMGSGKRFQYTVMGDAVNQASRFESANKCYGTLIIIGETTYEAVKDSFETRLLDRIVVKGKTRPVRVYELLARSGELSIEKRQTVELYEEALELHWERKFKEAIDRLDAALAELKDEPSFWLRKRILCYLETPPPEDWKGEFASQKQQVSP